MKKQLTAEEQKFYNDFLVRPENVQHMIAIDNAYEDLLASCGRLAHLGMGLYIIKCRVGDHLEVLNSEGFRNDPPFDVEDDGTYEV